MINYLITRFGFQPIIWFSTPLTSFIPISLVSVWKNFPFLVIILYAALTAIPEEIIEASKIDGVKGFTLFRLVTLPLILPALLVGLMFRMIFLIRTFRVGLGFTGGPGRDAPRFLLFIYIRKLFIFEFWKSVCISLDPSHYNIYSFKLYNAKFE